MRIWLLEPLGNIVEILSATGPKEVVSWVVTTGTSPHSPVKQSPPPMSSRTWWLLDRNCAVHPLGTCEQEKAMCQYQISPPLYQVYPPTGVWGKNKPLNPQKSPKGIEDIFELNYPILWQPFRKHRFAWLSSQIGTLHPRCQSDNPGLQDNYLHSKHHGPVG